MNYLCLHHAYLHRFQMRFKIIFFESYTPKLPFREGAFDQNDVDNINGIVEEVMAALQEEEEEEDVLVPWSSHVHLQAMVMELCNAGAMKGTGGRSNDTDYDEERDKDMDIDTKILWRCNDSVHSGRVLYEHYSRMLLDYFCSGGG